MIDRGVSKCSAEIPRQRLGHTSCIKQMRRISMHMFAITSICSFFLIPSDIHPIQSSLLMFILGQRRRSPFSSGNCTCRPFRADTRPALAHSRPAQKTSPSILAALSFPLSSFRRTEAVLSLPHGAEQLYLDKSSPPQDIADIKPSRRPLLRNQVLNDRPRMNRAQSKISRTARP
jgi:hypothetical protein